MEILNGVLVGIRTIDTGIRASWGNLDNLKIVQETIRVEKEIRDDDNIAFLSLLSTPCSHNSIFL